VSVFYRWRAATSKCRGSYILHDGVPRFLLIINLQTLYPSSRLTHCGTQPTVGPRSPGHRLAAIYRGQLLPSLSYGHSLPSFISATAGRQLPWVLHIASPRDKSYFRSICETWDTLPSFHNHPGRHLQHPEQTRLVGLINGSSKKGVSSPHVDHKLHSLIPSLSSSSDPLVFHGRHFGRTVFALCNYPSLLTNSILRLEQMEDTPLEDFPAE
jgi:hypothetical protein